MNIFFLVFSLSIYSINAHERYKRCQQVEIKTIHAFCEGARHLFKQDDGKLGEAVCGCTDAFLTHDFAVCDTNYHYPDAPGCQMLSNSNEFERSSSKENAFSIYYIYVLFGQIFDVCENKDRDDIDRFVKSIYTDKTMISVTEGVIELSFSRKEARLFNTCYRQLQKLAGSSSNTTMRLSGDGKTGSKDDDSFFDDVDLDIDF